MLSGKYNGGGRPEGARFSKYFDMGGRQAEMAKRFINDKSLASTERFMAIAARIGVSAVTLATAWSLRPEFVASTIVGASREDQLDEILAADGLTLDQSVLDEIDAVTREFMYPMG